MAIRSEALRSRQLGGGTPARTPDHASDATIYRFPAATVRHRAAVQRRRENLVRLVAGAALVISLLVVAGKLSSPPAAVSRPTAPAAVTVQPGQTLWGIAELYAAPGSDPRAYVDALENSNHVDAALQAGSRLRLP